MLANQYHTIPSTFLIVNNYAFLILLTICFMIYTLLTIKNIEIFVGKIMRHNPQAFLIVNNYHFCHYL